MIRRPKCEHCPLANQEEACTGQRNIRICQLADPASRSIPSVARQAVNFAKATVQHVAAGMPIASPEVQAERLAICQECDHFDADQSRCRQCGCGGMKLTWADQRCPLELPKWGPVTQRE